MFLIFFNVQELPTNRWQRKLWVLMEHADSSLMARLIAIFSILVILVSITTFCLESMPGFHDEFEILNNGEFLNNMFQNLERPIYTSNHWVTHSLNFSHYLSIFLPIR